MRCDGGGGGGGHHTLGMTMKEGGFKCRASGSVIVLPALNTTNIRNTSRVMPRTTREIEAEVPFQGRNADVKTYRVFSEPCLLLGMRGQFMARSH